MVVFGDSLSDAGNLKRRLLVFPNSPYWFGRFANGPSWTEYLADRTGVAVQNHAYGGAVAVKHEGVPSEDIIAAIQQGAQFFLTGSVDNQVKDYLERDLQGGVVKQPAEVVYVLWGGANDYISKEPFTGDIGTLLDSPEGKRGYRRVVDEAVASLAEQVRRLYAAGGRRFVVMNLPNLGRTPIVLQNQSYLPAEQTKTEAERRLLLSRKLGELTAFHNQKLAAAVGRLDRELPEAQFVTVDAARSWTRSSTAAPPTPGASASTTASRCASSGARCAPAAAAPASRSAATRAAISARSIRRASAGSRRTRCSGTSCIPSSYTHCWVAYFVQRELAKAGLVAAPGSGSRATRLLHRPHPAGLVSREERMPADDRTRARVRREEGQRLLRRALREPHRAHGRRRPEVRGRDPARDARLRHRRARSDGDRGRALPRAARRQPDHDRLRPGRAILRAREQRLPHRGARAPALRLPLRLTPSSREARLPKHSGMRGRLAALLLTLLAAPAAQASGKMCAAPTTPVLLVLVESKTRVPSAASGLSSTRRLVDTADTVIYADGRAVTSDLAAVSNHLNALGWAERPNRNPAGAGKQLPPAGVPSKRRRG